MYNICVIMHIDCDIILLYNIIEYLPFFWGILKWGLQCIYLCYVDATYICIYIYTYINLYIYIYTYIYVYLYYKYIFDFLRRKYKKLC